MLFIPKKFFLCGKPDINRLAGTPVLFHEGAKNFNLDTIYHFFEQTLGITNPAFSFDNVDLFSSLYRLQQGLAMLLIPSESVGLWDYQQITHCTSRRSALYLLVLPDQETGDTRLS